MTKKYSYIIGQFFSWFSGETRKKLIKKEKKLEGCKKDLLKNQIKKNNENWGFTWIDALKPLFALNTNKIFINFVKIYGSLRKKKKNYKIKGNKENEKEYLFPALPF